MIAARQDNPQTRSLDFWMSLLPEDSPYRLTVQGTAESVSQLTVADCREFHDQYFVPNNMVLAVFGDVDPEATLALIEKRFGQVAKDKDFSFPEFPAEHTDVAGREGQMELPIPDSAMVLTGYATVSAYDQEARAALEVLDSVLTGGSGAGGRLFNELRGEGLVYYVFAHELTGMAPGYFLFMAQTRPETVDEVVQRIQANISQIADSGLPDDEFALAKEKLIAAHAQRNTTPTSQAFQAAVDELYGLGYDYDRGYEERIKAVTIEDLRQVVKQFFHDPIVATAAPKS
jgi:zinc protease